MLRRSILCLQRPPVPPFTEATARQKVQAAEDAWNSRDPERVAMAYSEDTEWRNRDVFLKGRAAVRDFLQNKWTREKDYRLVKHYFAHTDNRIAVTFQYEYENQEGQLVRAYGNEHWTFDDEGYMKIRNASINDVIVTERSISSPAKVTDGFPTGTGQ